MLRPWLSPGKRKDVVFLCDVVCQPAFQPMGTTDLFPNNTRRLGRQRIFNVNSLFSHTLRVSFTIGLELFYATKVVIFLEIKNILRKNFGSFRKSSTFAPA